MMEVGAAWRKKVCFPGARMHGTASQDSRVSGLRECVMSTVCTYVTRLVRIVQMLIGERDKVDRVVDRQG